jgi:hypothetical protein
MILYTGTPSKAPRVPLLLSTAGLLTSPAPDPRSGETQPQVRVAQAHRMNPGAMAPLAPRLGTVELGSINTCAAVAAKPPSRQKTR